MSPPAQFAAIVVVAAAVAGGAFVLGARGSDEIPPEPGPGFGVGSVHPAEPRTDDWAMITGDLQPGIEPGSANPCQAGRAECVAAVVAEMEARLAELGCAHTAPFAFTYLEMTRGVEAHVARSDFFADPAALAHFDALFAEFYFEAIDNWRAGRHAHVPAAWQVAFAAADDRRASAPADILLGMNAHISRDLAYTVAALTEARPAATDRSEDAADFSRVDEVIATVQPSVVEGAAARFDPGIASLERMLVPADEEVDATRLIELWRARAFELGRRLATAEDEATRDAVAAEIERGSLASATLILNLEASRSLGLPPDQRDAYCRQQHTGAEPMPQPATAMAGQRIDPAHATLGPGLRTGSERLRRR